MEQGGNAHSEALGADPRPSHRLLPVRGANGMGCRHCGHWASLTQPVNKEPGDKFVPCGKSANLMFSAFHHVS